MKTVNQWVSKSATVATVRQLRTVADFTTVAGCKARRSYVCEFATVQICDSSVLGLTHLKNLPKSIAYGLATVATVPLYIRLALNCRSAALKAGC